MRIGRDKEELETMVGMYCRGNHGTRGELCDDCRALLLYGKQRLDRCVYGEAKPVCSQCPIHCYKPDMRQKVIAVMRYSGPRMVFRNPSSVAGHMWRKWAPDKSVLWRLLRPHTLTASFVPVLIGSVLALPTGQFKPELAAAMLLASVLAQSATNMFNEYYDYKRGLDHKESVGIGGAIVRDGLAAKSVFRLAAAFIAVTLLLGGYIMQHSSWVILPWGLACLAVGYLYSGGPYPLSATPLGELAAGTCMGLGIIAIAYYIHTLLLAPIVVLVSVPSSVLIGAILMANNIRDLEDDTRHGRKTLAILCGKKNAIRVLAGMFAGSVLWVAGLSMTGYLSLWALLVLLSIPKMAQAIIGFRAGTTAATMMPAMVATAQANTLFGLLLAAGIWLGKS